jgi:SMC interacting uncharacterized protein involved in chromosome segregation
MGWSICSKHDDISEAARKIESLAEDITSWVSAAKDDGIAMEKGLDTKRKRIDELESQVEYLEQENATLTARIADLEEELRDRDLRREGR